MWYLCDICVISFVWCMFELLHKSPTVWISTKFDYQMEIVPITMIFFAENPSSKLASITPYITSIYVLCKLFSGSICDRIVIAYKWSRPIPNAINIVNKTIFSEIKFWHHESVSILPNYDRHRIVFSFFVFLFLIYCSDTITRTYI